MNKPVIEADNGERQRALSPATCSAEVADFTGYHFHKCNKPAKWLINNQPRCGQHAMGKYLKTIRVPLPPNEKN